MCMPHRLYNHHGFIMRMVKIMFRNDESLICGTKHAHFDQRACVISMQDGVLWVSESSS